MKHRSVIAFVIVAAALFSLPQLSHDLRALRGAVGARLHNELLHAFLNLPAGEPASAAPAARPAETLLASCGQERSGAPAPKAGRGRARGKSFEQNAMIGDPVNDPLYKGRGDEIKDAAEVAVASLPEFKVETTVAMIVPPDGVVGPRGVARALAPGALARADADKLLAEAEGLRVTYAAAAARSRANDPEWQKATEEAVRKLNSSLPGGAYEFRVVRDGAKTKVLKFKCAECPAPAPRLTRLPRQVAVTMPLPAPLAPAETDGE